LLGWPRHEMPMKHFKPEAGDPVYEAAEGCPDLAAWRQGLSCPGP
jgi:hypothetical protein